MRNLKLESKNCKFQHVTSTESLYEIMDDCQGLDILMLEQVVPANIASPDSLPGEGR